MMPVLNRMKIWTNQNTIHWSYSQCIRIANVFTRNWKKSWLTTRFASWTGQNQHVKFTLIWRYIIFFYFINYFNWSFHSIWFQLLHLFIFVTVANAVKGSVENPCRGEELKCNHSLLVKLKRNPTKISRQQKLFQMGECFRTSSNCQGEYIYSILYQFRSKTTLRIASNALELLSRYVLAASKATNGLWSHSSQNLHFCYKWHKNLTSFVWHIYYYIVSYYAINVALFRYNS